MTISFDDLDTPLTFAPVKAGKVDLDRTHIVNGGNATQALVPCVKCRGSGTWGWSGRRCFRCDGKGQITVRSAAATKAKATREANERTAFEAFVREHTDLILFLSANEGWSDFFRSMHDQVKDMRPLTERQIAAVRSAMAKIAARREEKAVERAASAPKVDVSAIERLFATANASGLKRPVFRADGIEVSQAAASGRNPGALYVKAGGDYQGKIAGGAFLATRTALGSTLGKLLAVAADPLGQAKLYGRLTGSCSCCGRELTDPVSVANGIGPICQRKWGI